MNSKSNIKALKSRFQKLEEECAILKIELNNVHRSYDLKRKQLKELKLKIDNFEEQEISVSDHAIVRYLERIDNLDIDNIKQRILSQEVLVLIEKLGKNGRYPNQDFQIVLKNGVVITVLKK